MPVKHQYWTQEGTADAIAKMPPKSAAFFTAWFGPAGTALFACYMRSYRSCQEKS